MFSKKNISSRKIFRKKFRQIFRHFCNLILKQNKKRPSERTFCLVAHPGFEPGTP